MNNNKTIGQILREARAKKGLTQTKLANKTGIYWNTIAKIEGDKQKPKFSTIKKLAEELDIDIRKLPTDG